MKNLVKFLANLDTTDTQWGLYVNPKNLDDFRVGQRCFDNGGLCDEKVFVGSLSSLSCSQSLSDALEVYLDEFSISGISKLQYKGRVVRCSKEGILRAFQENRLDPEFSSFLEEEASLICGQWALEEAWETAERIKDLLKIWV